MQQPGVEPGTPGTVVKYAHHYTVRAGWKWGVSSFCIKHSAYYSNIISIYIIIETIYIA